MENYLNEQGLATYDTLIKSYISGVMTSRSEIPQSLMAVINDIDSHVDTMLSNYVTKTDLQSALANIGGGEVITINIINADGNCHVEMTSGTTVIDNNVANGSTITIPFGVEYTITGYDGDTIIEDSQITNVAAKMSNNLIIDCGMIDLGLPSGKLWSNKNVGAANPYDAGLYFTWGNTEGASSGYFDNQTYSFTNGAKLSASFTSGDPAYDAARANMGEDWRMPTRTECQELIDNCTWTWSYVNGTSGYIVKGSNNNTIFLPAAGYYKDNTLSNAGSTGYYWSTTYSDSSSAYFLFFNNGSTKSTSYHESRYYGRSVRAIRDPQS